MIVLLYILHWSTFIFLKNVARNCYVTNVMYVRHLVYNVMWISERSKYSFKSYLNLSMWTLILTGFQSTGVFVWERIMKIRIGRPGTVSHVFSP